ncbi:MAG: signal peptidase I [Oscillospiraceae bacterium]|nr:signal peptidase I [Oscillospiraceae bacterium]
MEKVKNALTILASVVLWAIILIAALFAFTTLATRDTNNVANIAGFTPLSVLSDSMKPTFNQGDLIIIHTVDPKTLNEGDIITFHTIINNEYTLNTHRISKIADNNGVRSYTTMGDNNNGIADSHIIADGDIVGKYVTRLPGVGNVMSFLSSPIGFLIVIVLPMLAFFVYQVYHLIIVSINLKKAVAIENAEENAKLSKDLEDAQRAKEEAAAALAEAKRIKEEAEKQLAEAKKDLNKE